MQLTGAISAAMSDAVGLAFDRRASRYLAARHPRRCDAAPDLPVWVSHWRRWLDQRGVRAEQHVIDHLEIVLVHGATVVEHPDYRRVMRAPLLSSEEKAVRLRRLFLPEVSDG